jgi:DnaK suppressor protein
LNEIEKISQTLRERLRALDAEDDMGTEDRSTVHLDQQSVGRLSRMDAMQRQQMAQANERRRRGERVRIEAALNRIEDGEYGACADCGEDIAPARLAADPATPRCLPCARG